MSEVSYKWCINDAKVMQETQVIEITSDNVWVKMWCMNGLNEKWKFSLSEGLRL